MKEKETQNRHIMNTKLIALAMFLTLLLAVSLSSCKKAELEKYPTQQFGKWQLVAALYYTETGESVTLDYSEANIIYDFRKNNVLAVSGEIEGIEDYRGHEIGEYSCIAFPIPTFSLAQIKIGADTLTYYYLSGDRKSGGTGLLTHIGTQMHLDYLNNRVALELIKTDESIDAHHQ